VLIQSPYLVLSDPALALFRETLARGVRIRISTNSLASTDNLQAFGGYRAQRRELLAMGLDVREYRPDPAVQREVMQRYEILRPEAPVFALHAKTLVVDREVVVIGTYNLDPALGEPEHGGRAGDPRCGAGGGGRRRHRPGPAPREQLERRDRRSGPGGGNGQAAARVVLGPDADPGIALGGASGATECRRPTNCW
jgi:hypothetical protein